MYNENDRVKIINDLIPDENLRKIIFNHSDRTSTFLDDDKLCIDYFSNTLVFIFFFIYKAFLNWKKKNKENISEYSNSMVRIYNILNSCYSEKKVTYDFIEDLIVNLQIDLSVKAGGFLQTLGLERLFAFETNLLNKSIYMLKQKRISSRYVSDFKFEEMCNFFAMLPLFHYIKVDLKNIDNFTSKKAFQKVVVSFKFLQLEPIELEETLIVGRRNCAFLEELVFNDKKEFGKEQAKEQSITANYLYFESDNMFTINYVNNDELPFDEKSSVIRYETAIEDLLIKHDIYNFRNLDKKSYFFQDYIFFNNQYIKSIALVISDTITAKTKEMIVKKYKSKYEDIFKKLTFHSMNGEYYIRWDEVIIFLLLEEGIYPVLKTVLDSVEYEDIIRNFKLRFGENVSAIINRDEAISNPTINLHYKNVETKKKIKARAIISLATKLLSINEVNVVHDYSAASIRDMIEDFKIVYQTKSRSDFEKIYYFVNRVTNITLFIESFYKGLLEYVVEKAHVELPLGNRWFDNHEEYVNAKKRYLNKFVKASTEEKHNAHSIIKSHLKIKNDHKEYFGKVRENILAVFNILLELNTLVSKRNSRENEQLFEATGRRQLFKEKEILKCLDTLIAAIDESINLDVNSSDEMVKKIYMASIVYLEYLRDGSFDNTDNIEESIYPIVSSYSNSVISKDGYRYSYIYVNQGRTGEPVRIKVISDDEFKFDEFYYCIPNINRIANIKVKNAEEERIWVNPIVIPYHSYPYNVTTSFVKLEDEKDFDAVSELLYNTDQKIYKNLFGSLENAKKVLAKLYNKKKILGKKTIFHKDFIYLLKTNNDAHKVLAIATCYNEMPEWRSIYILEAFEEAGVEVPENIEDAFAYFKDTFEEYNGEGKNIICDICVKEGYRNNGLGKMMLTNLIKKATKESRDLVITVYEDNNVAFNLYNSLGFIPYTYSYDNRGTGDNKEKYYKLIKFI